MPNYQLEKADSKCVVDKIVVADVLQHLSQHIKQCRLRKIGKRRGFAKAAYGVAKLFGHRSAHRDLYLASPSALRSTTRDAATSDDSANWIPVSDMRGVKVFYRLTILGKESRTDNALGGHAIMPNQIETNVKNGFREFWVDMELSGPALEKLCRNLNRAILWEDKLRPMLQEKWGSGGVSLGTYATEDGGEDYRFVRLIDGIAKSYLGGWGNAGAGQWTTGLQERSYASFAIH